MRKIWNVAFRIINCFVATFTNIFESLSEFQEKHKFQVN